MKLIVNGNTRELPAPQTVATLLVAEGQAGRRLAVEVNREIVPRSRHAEHPLHDCDQIELIQAIGGG
ncbi:sulfur carrier protein ThiS [soil metagenome]